jgi:hypothetical protein
VFVLTVSLSFLTYKMGEKERQRCLCPAFTLVAVPSFLPWVMLLKLSPCLPIPLSLLRVTILCQEDSDQRKAELVGFSAGCPQVYPSGCLGDARHRSGEFPFSMNQLCDPILIPARAPPSHREWGTAALLGKSPKSCQSSD